MKGDISNFLLRKIINKDKDITNKEKEILKTKSEDKTFLINQYIDLLCDKVSKALNKTIIPPKLVFSDELEQNMYLPEQNIMALYIKGNTISNILHEFRHLLQAQLKEPSYTKVNDIQLPEPFYRLQEHEKNAYRFQALFENNPIKSLLDFEQTLHEDKMKMQTLGFDKNAYNKEQIYFEDYNVLLDLLSMPDELLDILYPDREEILHEETENIEKIVNGGDIPDEDKRKYFSFDDKEFNIVEFNVNDKKYFTIKWYDYDKSYMVDFGLYNDGCVIYNFRPDTSENYTHALDKIMSYEEYNDMCKTSFDLVMNFVKAYGLNDVYINPYSFNINRDLHEKVISDIKRDYMGRPDEFSFNEICNATAKTNIVDELKVELKLNNIDENKIDINSDKIIQLAKIKDKEALKEKPRNIKEETR